MTESTVKSAWHPLLTAGLADRAAEIILEIADALRDRSSDEPPQGSLAGGDAGIALFHAYLARVAPTGGHEATSRRHLERAIDTLATKPMTPGFYDGFTGVAWAVEHLVQKASAAEGGEVDLNEEIDEVLEGHLRDANGGTWTWPSCELISGLAGVGVYALERRPRPSAARMLEHIVARLAALSERTPEGITWFTAPEQLPPSARRKSPAGYYNLGVAHGIPGAIGFLGQACAAGIAESEARQLLDGAVRWLLAQRSPSGGGAAFPTWIAPNGRPPAERVSWCYGNPGLAVALLVAARAVGEKSWEADALELASASAAQGMCEYVIEAGICHGSAGNGHLFNRLFQATGDERFREAAVAWFARTLEFHRPGTGIAGFVSKTFDAEGETAAWVGKPGFLSGVAGIGLTLLAATTAIEPEWDRMIMSSLPPQG